MLLYKLTDTKGQTKYGTQWGVGVTHNKPVVANPTLCSDEVLHAYTSPLLAVLMNPAHAAFSVPRLWEAIGEVVVSDGTKVGVFQLTTTKEISLPIITAKQQTRFAILCALEVYKDSKFKQWAERWLSGKDRSRKAAYAAAYAANAAANAAAIIDFADLAKRSMDAY